MNKPRMKYLLAKITESEDKSDEKYNQKRSNGGEETIRWSNGMVKYKKILQLCYAL